MGAVILQAGDLRRMRPTATVMLHEGTAGIPDNHVRNVESGSRQGARERKLMYEIFAERCGKPVKYYRQKLAFDWYMNATEAVAENIADEVAI
jgi:ATP-dependent protease ClpP protease subunit